MPGDFAQQNQRMTLYLPPPRPSPCTGRSAWPTARAAHASACSTIWCARIRPRAGRGDRARGNASFRSPRQPPSTSPCTAAPASPSVGCPSSTRTPAARDGQGVHAQDGGHDARQRIDDRWGVFTSASSAPTSLTARPTVDPPVRGSAGDGPSSASSRANAVAKKNYARTTCRAPSTRRRPPFAATAGNEDLGADGGATATATGFIAVDSDAADAQRSRTLEMSSRTLHGGSRRAFSVGSCARYLELENTNAACDLPHQALRQSSL